MFLSRGWGLSALDVLSVLLCVGGGLILLTLTSASSAGYSLTGHTVFEGIAHGIGLYCIGRGIAIARAAYRGDKITSSLARLVELATLQHLNPSGSAEAARDDERS